ncbi:hypothetical protein MBLNU230_g0992t1 [Neophaeotheca triangularis]
MGLVDYSDSEGSDSEAPVAAKVAPPAAKAETNKPAFQKVINRSNPGTIKVGLPTVQPEPGQQDGEVEGPPAKRRKAGGALGGGFSAMLPAPKRAGQGKSNDQPKRGPGLKTSSEASFGQAPPRSYEEEGGQSGGAFEVTARKPAAEEAPMKLEGKSTASRFRPMSVKNKNKPKKPIVPSGNEAFGVKEAKQTDAKPAPVPAPEPSAELAPKPKPKRSLFGAPQEDEGLIAELPVTATTSTAYEPMLSEPTLGPNPEEALDAAPQFPLSNPQAATSTSLATTADDLNLTPAERRQLFGKHGEGNFQVSHFNTRDEYDSNEKLRQAGEVTQHRAVKAVAPGKHSLQQLVNNAKTQQEGLEDAWAAGRSKRAEGAGRYGW